MHKCSMEELGLANSDGKTKSKFYPTIPSRIPELLSQAHKYYCFDKPENLKIRGNWNAAEADIVALGIRRCHNRPDCKSEEEI